MRRHVITLTKTVFFLAAALPIALPNSASAQTTTPLFQETFRKNILDNLNQIPYRVTSSKSIGVNNNPNLIIELHGHTDPRASDAYNIELGQRRASNTRKYLLKKGIDPSRMTIRSFGERQLLSDGNRKIDYARDRRTEVIFKDIRDIEIIVQEDDLQIEE